MLQQAFDHLQLHRAERSMRPPVDAARISSEFGGRLHPFGHGKAFHHGMDFAAVRGTPVRAAANGIVVRARYQPDYGNVVLIDHGGEFATLYAHNASLQVGVGDRVKAGQQIGQVGSTGQSTGPHLHFEVRHAGKRTDPRRFLAGL
jgi:murein DD-endopeptidase MepM/ murein hydrolase activator NlpD